MLLDILKAKQILDWEPKVSLKDRLNKEYLWACMNLNRWDKINSTKW
jgi:nucleoside-diphosphate-sugar epimerase